MANKAFWGRIALFGTALIWGTSFIILKAALDSIGTMWILAIRFSIAAGILALFCVPKLKAMDKRTFKGSVLLGITLATAYIVQTYGLMFTSPGKNAFLTSIYCVLVPFMAWGIYRRKPDSCNIIAAFLCVAGIGFVSLSSSEGGLNIGDVLTLICGIFYALQIIIMENYIEGQDALPISTVQFATSAVICWIGALLFEPVPGALSVGSWISIVYMGVMCTGVGFFLQAWGMKYTPSATASVIISLEAVFGALFSVLFYNEPMTIKLFTGFALIFVSVLVSETKPRFLMFAKKERRSI